jgi:NAD(P)-dependent dehydrogenase (short-subunit alcohol dehydrogenase family)
MPDRDGKRHRQLGSMGQDMPRNVTSFNGQKGQFGQTSYCVSKAGIASFTNALALEKARSVITVNCIAPSYCETDMVSTVPEPVLKTILAEISVQRLGQPADVAGSVAFWQPWMLGLLLARRCLERRPIHH